MTLSMKEFEAAPQGFSLISNRKLLALYTTMLACRQLAEREAGDAKAAGRRADSMHGHEAAVVGAAIDLHAGDTVAQTLWPGIALKAVNGATSQISSYSAAVRAARLNRSPHAVAVLFSSGKASSQAGWEHAVTQAAEHNLPMLFVQLHRPGTVSDRFQPDQAAIALKRPRYTLPVIYVDGNDVVAMYRVASESITHARKDHGPTFIDCRLSMPADPLINMERYLIGKGLDPAAFDA